MIAVVNGNRISGFSHNLGITNPLAVELWAIRDKLLIALDNLLWKAI
jgi:hypothetical protein